MRFIKLFFISVIVLSLLLTTLSLLFPPHLHIARDITISSSNEKIFSVIDDLHTWNKWNKIVSDSALTNLKIYPSGYTATSDQIDVLIKKDSIGGILVFWKQHNGKQFNGGFKLMQLTADSTKITVQWYFDFTFKWYPWEKFSSLVYDKQFQPVMEESLNNLKQLIENNP
jgi:polyketide cyclase/dehydrase/lipid transport protein